MITCSALKQVQQSFLLTEKAIKVSLTINDQLWLGSCAFILAGTCRYSLLELMAICLWRPCLSPSDDITCWCHAKTTVGNRLGLGGGGAHSVIIPGEAMVAEGLIFRVKSLLLPLHSACRTITKETCQWEPRAYSSSVPVPLEQVGTPNSSNRWQSPCACMPCWQWEERRRRDTEKSSHASPLSLLVLFKWNNQGDSDCTKCTKH